MMSWSPDSFLSMKGQHATPSVLVLVPPTALIDEIDVVKLERRLVSLTTMRLSLVSMKKSTLSASAMKHRGVDG